MPHQPKENHYAAEISAKIKELIDDEIISWDELSEGDNAKDFIHALSNMVPCLFYHTMTGERMDILEFNHLSNRLCFEYAKKQSTD